MLPLPGYCVERWGLSVPCCFAVWLRHCYIQEVCIEGDFEWVGIPSERHAHDHAATCEAATAQKQLASEADDMYDNAFKGTSPSKATFHLLHAEIIKRVKSQDQSVCVISHLVRKVNNPPLLFSIVSHNSFVYVSCLYCCLPCLQFHTRSACFQFYTHDFDPRPLNTTPLYIKLDLTWRHSILNYFPVALFLYLLLMMCVCALGWTRWLVCVCWCGGSVVQSVAGTAPDCLSLAWPAWQWCPIPGKSTRRAKQTVAKGSWMDFWCYSAVGVNASSSGFVTAMAILRFKPWMRRYWRALVWWVGYLWGLVWTWLLLWLCCVDV